MDLVLERLVDLVLGRLVDQVLGMLVDLVLWEELHWRSGWEALPGVRQH